MQYEEAQMELSDLKEKCMKTEQEKQSLTDHLEECKANMKELQEKGSKVSADQSDTSEGTGNLLLRSCNDVHVLTL